MGNDNVIKVSELIQDDKNFNIGSESGAALIDKSFDKFKAGRSILIDKNNKIIAGNKSAQHFKGQNVRIMTPNTAKSS